MTAGQALAQQSFSNGHRQTTKWRSILRPLGRPSEYVLARDDAGLWSTPSVAGDRNWVAAVGTRVCGMPYEVSGLPWLLIHGIEPRQWRHVETGGEAEELDFDAGCWALMEGTALGLPGDLFEPTEATEEFFFEMGGRDFEMGGREKSATESTVDSAPADDSRRWQSPAGSTPTWLLAMADSDYQEAENGFIAANKEGMEGEPSKGARPRAPSDTASTAYEMLESEGSPDAVGSQFSFDRQCSRFSLDSSMSGSLLHGKTRADSLLEEILPVLQTSVGQASPSTAANDSPASSTKDDSSPRPTTENRGASSPRPTTSTRDASPPKSTTSPRGSNSNSAEVCIGGDFEVRPPGKATTLPFRDELSTVMPRMQALYMYLTNDQEFRLELGGYKGHNDAILFFLLGVTKAPFTKGARKHAQAVVDALAKSGTGMLGQLLSLSESENKEAALPSFREKMNDCIQELLACLVNLVAFVDESVKALAFAALEHVEMSAAAVSYGLPDVPVEEQCHVVLSILSSLSYRKITVRRHTNAGALRTLLVERLGFPASIRLLGAREHGTRCEEHGATLYPLPNPHTLVDGGIVTVHGAITLHPGLAEDSDPRERTQAEVEWAFLGNVPRVTIVEAIEMFRELKAGFGDQAFQDELHKCQKAYLEATDAVVRAKAKDKVTELACRVQSKVIAKYGYPCTPEGVKQMRTETMDMYKVDERLFPIAQECQELLSVKEDEPPEAAASEKLPRIGVTSSRRFEVASVEAWKEHLNTHGFVVLANVVGQDQRAAALDLLWDFLEASDARNQIDRDDYTSWQDSRQTDCGWPARKDGSLLGRGIGQSAFMWYLRGLPQTREVFESIWGTDAVVTSFDGANVCRPIGLDKKWKTSARHWYHVDQAHSKRGLHCIQGMVTLTDSTEGHGGLVVVPGSHKFHAEVLRKYEAKEKKDYIQLQAKDDLLKEGGGPKLVVARAGDLILWDSRTIHCNTAPLKPDPDQSNRDLLRAAAYICMTPAAWCPQDVQTQRSMAVRNCATSTHWPHELQRADGAVAEQIHTPQVQLSPKQKELIGPAPGQLRSSKAAPAQGQPSLCSMVNYRVAKDQAAIVEVPLEKTLTPIIARVSKGQVLSGHVFGNWFRLSLASLREVLRHNSVGAKVMPEKEGQEAWLFCGGGVAVRA